MPKSIGIARNRYQALQSAKKDLTRKQNIFKIIGKEDQFSQNETAFNHTNHLLSAKTTNNSANESDSSENNVIGEVYDDAKHHLDQVAQYRKKMTAEIKLRMGSFRDSDIKMYEGNINKYSAKAIDHLLKAQRILLAIKKTRGTTETSEKFYRNMERSLALDIREATKALRAHQKDYFDRVKAYQNGSTNPAVYLRPQQRQRMKDDFDDMQICETEITEDLQRNKQIAQLVKSINQLASVYKQLNQMVIAQGSLIDRIDFNIEETYDHMKNANKHLEGAEEMVDNSCARKCMCILIIAIIIMSMVIGFKLAK